MDADDSDTSSLITITPSLRETLYRYQGSRRFQSSSDDYRESVNSRPTSPLFALGPPLSDRLY